VRARGHQGPGQPLELPVVTRTREMGVAHVIGEVEAAVVHPHRLSESWRGLEALAVARESMQPRLHESPHALDVDAAVRSRQLTALEHRDGADVHVAVAVFDLEEAVVERRESLEMRIRHTLLRKLEGSKKRAPPRRLPRACDPARDSQEPESGCRRL